MTVGIYKWKTASSAALQLRNRYDRLKKRHVQSVTVQMRPGSFGSAFHWHSSCLQYGTRLSSCALLLCLQTLAWHDLHAAYKMLFLIFCSGLLTHPGKDQWLEDWEGGETPKNLNSVLCAGDTDRFIRCCRYQKSQRSNIFAAGVIRAL